MFTRLKKTLSPDSIRARRFATGLGFIAIAALASVSIFATGPDSAPAPRTEKAWPVSVIEVSPGVMQPTFSVHGRVESSNVTHLRTDLNAEVKAVHVREGDWVEQGAPLITLDDSELELRAVERRAELDELNARLESTRIEQAMVTESTEHYRSMQQVAENKLKRHQDLMAKRLISQALLDEVTAQANQANIEYQTHLRTLADFPNRLAAQRAAVERARALLSQAELDIGKTRITAPYPGPILGVFVAPGDRSGIGAILADIANADTFEVRVQVPERYGSRLHEDLIEARQVTAVTRDGTTLYLSRLSGQVKPGQSGLDAFFELDTASSAPRRALGRLLELTITLPAEESVIAVPVQSVYENDRIYAIEESPVAADPTALREYRLQAITVERVGEAQDSDGGYRVLVRSPSIHPGARIITTQLPRAITGLLVEPA